jgi:hypothetical protein
MTWRRIIGAGLIGIALVVVLLWSLRARLAAELAREYFRSHGVVSSVDIEGLGLSGVSGRFALGPAGAPEISAERIELRFDPLRLMPRVVEVRLVNPVIRARVEENGAVTLPSLQTWIDSLRSAQGQSRFVSDDLAVSLTGLRAFLASPYGALELDGDVKLVRNLPVAAALALKPASIAYAGTTITLRAARLAFESKGGRASVHLSADLRNSNMALDGFDADLSAVDLRWTVSKNGFALAAPSLQLTGSARTVHAGLSATAAFFNLKARDFRLLQSRGGWEGHGDLQVAGGADLAADGVRALLAGDRVLANAAADNLRHLDMAVAGHLNTHGSQVSFVLSEPATLRGAAGGVLQVPEMTVEGGGQDFRGSLKAALSGARLPAITFGMPHFALTGGVFRGDADMGARLDYAAFRGVAIHGAGSVSGQAGEWAFLANSCAKLSMAAFRPGPENLASGIGGMLCPAANKPMLAFGKNGLTVNAAGRDMAADIPFAGVRLEKAQTLLNFSVASNVPLHGTVALSSARMLDRAKTLRFKPLSGSGRIALSDGVWRGTIAAAADDEKKSPLGDLTFTHTMANGAGTAHIAAPHIAFAAGKLQPENLSPLLAAFRNAEGAANFTGDIAWRPGQITSTGHLSIGSLDFLTPLGKAHTVKTEMDFVSLLPPATKAGQDLTIARIDWTLPFSALDVRFGFSPTAIQVDKVSSGFAEGRASLGAFTIDLANPKRIDGAADLSSISLAALVAASNLGSKVRLEGKVSGHVPFSAGPDGFRIVNGHVQADGAGRLSIDRSLWAQGGAATTNAVQDFAYQALENLSFDQLSADLNSVPGGRLQVLFHIKGRSDPPKPQQAEVGLVDLINGTALQKPIPLPNGTPIDLTLDTSLNFDELLKSYGEAWSKTLQGQTD